MADIWDDPQGNQWEYSGEGDFNDIANWNQIYNAAEQAAIDAGLRSSAAGAGSTGEYTNPVTLNILSRIAEQNATLSAAAAAGNRQAAVALAELQYRMRQGELDTGLGILSLVAKMGGPANAFQQQNVLHSVNQQGLSRAVDAIAGRIVLPTTQAPQATPEAMTLDSLLKQLGANPSTGSPFSVPAGGGRTATRPAAPVYGNAPWPGAQKVAGTRGPALTEEGADRVKMLWTGTDADGNPIYTAVKTGGNELGRGFLAIDHGSDNPNNRGTIILGGPSGPKGESSSYQISSDYAKDLESRYGTNPNNWIGGPNRGPYGERIGNETAAWIVGPNGKVISYDYSGRPDTGDADYWAPYASGPNAPGAGKYIAAREAAGQEPVFLGPDGLLHDRNGNIIQQDSEGRILGSTLPGGWSLQLGGLEANRLKAAARGQPPDTGGSTFIGGDPMLDFGYVFDPESGLYYDPTGDINQNETWRNPDNTPWEGEPSQTEPTNIEPTNDEIPQDAAGGFIRSRPHIVGEAGPELAEWTPSGTAIIPLTRPATGLRRDLRALGRGMADGGFIAGDGPVYAGGDPNFDETTGQYRDAQPKFDPDTEWLNTAKHEYRKHLLDPNYISPYVSDVPQRLQQRYNDMINAPPQDWPYPQDGGFVAGGPADDSSKWAGQSNQPQDLPPPQDVVPQEPDWLKALPRNDTNLARARQYLTNHPPQGFGGDFGPTPDWATISPEDVWHQLSTYTPSQPSAGTVKGALDYVRQAARTYSPTEDGAAADTMDDAAFYQYAKGKGLLNHLGGPDNPNRQALSIWAGEWAGPEGLINPAPEAGGTPITDIKEYAKALPNPNQIVGREWMKLPDSSKQFLLSAYKDMGWDTSDVVDAIVKGLPGAASWRAPYATVRR